MSVKHLLHRNGEEAPWASVSAPGLMSLKIPNACVDDWPARGHQHSLAVTSWTRGPASI